MKAFVSTIDIRLKWMPCGETYANAVFFRIRVTTYTLFQSLKRLALLAWWRNSTIAMVRGRFYQVAARLVYHTHQVLLKLATSLDKISLFRQVCYEYL